MSHVFVWGPQQIESAIGQIDRLAANVKLASLNSENLSKRRLEQIFSLLKSSNFVLRDALNTPTPNFRLFLYKVLSEIMSEVGYEVFIDGSQVDVSNLQIADPVVNKNFFLGVVADYLPVAELSKPWRKTEIGLIWPNIETFQRIFANVSQQSKSDYPKISLCTNCVSVLLNISIILAKNAKTQIPNLLTFDRNNLTSQINDCLYHYYGIHTE